ncbi:Veg family protein [Apilactobacillus apisilvae]|uniref:Veg family protein n=1 Tax=Apilactobacillus apisilvae TaxID=2923364 RepID=A0ABY4PGP7_9LACO|nr:Veg family protein [Apilactobacillus apisilvae]UQS84986.1 Veg family protein [Apilactobacillus apisilvae]
MPANLNTIKDELDNRLGEKVMVTVQVGRNKTLERHGTLSETFPAVFIVDLEKDENLKRVSYSYTDILTKNIEVDFDDSNIEEV